MVARVASVQGTSAEAKGGVMIREGLEANSRYAAMLLTRSNGAKMQRRISAGGPTTTTVAGGLAAPHWVKIVRSGTAFTGWTSPDGVSWTFVGAGTISMSSSVFVGLALNEYQEEHRRGE